MAGMVKCEVRKMTAEVKHDSAEKAYADAAATVAEKPVAAKPAAVKKAAVKKAAVKKAAVKMAGAKKSAKKITAPAAAKAAAKTTETKTNDISQIKDTIMTKTKTVSEDFTAKAKEAAADVQSRAKAAFEKGSALFGEVNEFSKGNVEALVESGKILASGLQEIGKDYLAEGKSAIETVTADVKEFAAVKSPTDFFKLQGEIMRRNFDAAVASGSKHSEAFVKLANDAFAPISTRVSLAVEKVKKAA